MDTTALLVKHFAGNGTALEIVMEHSMAVAHKALAIAGRLDAPMDRQFIREASLLHDIGVCRINAPGIGCTGSYPYITHGIIGRQILESEGLPAHALVCERHIGVGLTAEDITAQGLPLPVREMVPISMEERIVCFADLFFSKHPEELCREKTVAEIEKSLGVFGLSKVAIFREWVAEFGC